MENFDKGNKVTYNKDNNFELEVLGTSEGKYHLKYTKSPYPNQIGMDIFYDIEDFNDSHTKVGITNEELENLQKERRKLAVKLHSEIVDSLGDGPLVFEISILKRIHKILGC